MFFPELTHLGHADAQLENMAQCPDESLHLYILRYSKTHYTATNKTAQENTDPSRPFRFLASINNTAISENISRSEHFLKYLEESFKRALPLEADFISFQRELPWHLLPM